MKCTNCSKEITKDSKFCNYCGRPIVASFETGNGMERAIVPASTNVRFVNYLLDLIFVTIITTITVAITITILNSVHIAQNNKPLPYVLSFGIFFLYYFILEACTGKTIAKYITRTRVITEQGGKPSFAKAFIRSLCRFIPFDNFSFIVSSNPIGWHDSIAGTFVVREKDLKQLVDKG